MCVTLGRATHGPVRRINRILVGALPLFTPAATTKAIHRVELIYYRRLTPDSLGHCVELLPPADHRRAMLPLLRHARRPLRDRPGDTPVGGACVCP